MRLPIIPLALVTVLAAGCASVPPDQDPVQIRLNSLDARVSRVERIMSNQSLVQMAQQVSTLQAEVRDLRGRIDDLQNANRALARQERDYYTDLNKRVTRLEQGGSGAAAGPGANAGGSSGEPGVTSTQQAVYGQAFNALKAGSYSVAISGFKGFLKQYPASPLAPNAEYWLGQAHYVNQDFAAAEGDFQAVLDKWPNSAKAPAAMLDLGNTQLAQGKTAEGRATLREVVSQFPGTDAATRAQALLGKHSAQ
jgi:tol-pal system protein YbgF